MLPRECEFWKIYDVSRRTVGRAVNDLVMEGGI
nr:hypothetical protein [Bacillus licheniformis]